MAEATIKINDDSEARRLFGKHDENLKKIEKVFGVETTFRDGSLKIISGGEAETESLLVINQNFDRHFRGRPAPVETDGLLSVTLPPGPFHVVLTYRPLPTYLGIAVSLVSLLIFATAAFLRKRKTRGL